MERTWYAASGSKAAELWTILHLPYTAMNLSFLAMGFGIAGIHRWDVFAWITAAYFLGLTAAHALDQLPGQGTTYVKHLTPKDLSVIGAFSFIVAVTIGIKWMVTLGAWHLLWIIPLQTFFVVAYPYSRFAGGFFHNDFWFGLSFGFIPVMAGYYINTLTLTGWFLPWALVAALIAWMEITLSRYVRQIRAVPIPFALPVTLLRPERALKLLCLLSYLLAAILILGVIPP